MAYTCSPDAVCILLSVATELIESFAGCFGCSGITDVEYGIRLQQKHICNMLCDCLLTSKCSSGCCCRFIKVSIDKYTVVTVLKSIQRIILVILSLRNLSGIQVILQILFCCNHPASLTFGNC